MIDDQFNDRALEEIARRDESYAGAYDVQAAWESIRADLASRGPFTRMLLELRGTARQAMIDLVYATPTDPARIASLQGEVRRYAHMMTIISEYRQQAAVAEVNQSTDAEDVSEDDRTFIANLEFTE